MVLEMVLPSNEHVPLRCSMRSIKKDRHPVCCHVKSYAYKVSRLKSHRTLSAHNGAMAFQLK